MMDAVKRVGSLIILGLLLLAGQLSARAAPLSSDWPSINFDAAQSNDNGGETTLTAHNVLKLKVRWTSPIAEASYPIVAGGRVYLPVVEHGKVHVQVLDALTGKQVAIYAQDALGGMLAANGNLYLAGSALQEVDPSTGDKIGQIDPSPRLKGATFLYPAAGRKVLVAGYAGAGPNASTTLYVVDLQSNRVLWKKPSTSGQGAIGTGRILTRTSSGGVFYDQASGRAVAQARSVLSDWFAGSSLAYTVASVKGKNATLYAYDGTGHSVWTHVVGPRIVTDGWPHAMGKNMLYVQALSPRSEVQALDPGTGHILWTRPVGNVQRMVLAGEVLYVLTYGLGQPVRLLALKPGNGALIGGVVLSPGYYAFGAVNGLMVANGMVFIRAASASGSQLLALGL
jgi:outer membrane protein assembly factor BamB